MATNASVKDFLHSKKFVLIACVVLVLLFITLLLSFGQPTKENVIHTFPTAAHHQQTLPSPTVTGTIAQTDGTPGKWNTLNKPTYSIQYPHDWTVKEFPLANQGTIVTFKPAALPQGVEYPKFLLQMQNENNQAMMSSESILTGLRLKQTNDALGNQPVTKFSGTIPFATKNGHTVPDPIQDTTLFIKHGTTVYVLKYEYEGSQPDSGLENFFQGFILSFKLK
ncbi:MAG: hypothetical protein ACREHC_01140 [Candidatus Levyibacteriota bacterium]